MGPGRFTVVAAAVALALLTGGTAVAATPQQIYRDLADNGRLDRHYSDADLERALGGGLQRALNRPAKTGRSLEQGGAEGKRAAPSAEKRARLPFTGLDLALLTAGGGPLLLLGAGLRRRRIGSEARVVAG